MVGMARCLAARERPHQLQELAAWSSGESNFWTRRFEAPPVRGEEREQDWKDLDDVLLAVGAELPLNPEMVSTVRAQYATAMDPHVSAAAAIALHFRGNQRRRLSDGTKNDGRRPEHAL
jgi:hypothetical protein